MNRKIKSQEIRELAIRIRSIADELVDSCEPFGAEVFAAAEHLMALAAAIGRPAKLKGPAVENHK